MNILPAVCAPHERLVSTEVRSSRELDSLELDLGVVVNLHESAGNWNQGSSERAIGALKHKPSFLAKEPIKFASNIGVPPCIPTSNQWGGRPHPHHHLVLLGR